jgi:transcriptional regulator with PAS, ATPase and Fis domain
MDFDMDYMSEDKEESGFSQNNYGDSMTEAVKEAVKDLMEKTSEIESREEDTVVGINLADEVRRYEISLIMKALKLTRGNQRKAAKLLGISHTTLNSKIKRYKISL